MGTSRSGRYLNTKGASRSVSDFALVHSTEGKYTKPSKKKDKLRLVSGGHGQTGINQLKKYGIKYNIVKTYSNGVRVGNVSNHKDKRKRSGINQAWFPKSWTKKDIRRAGEHVASLKTNKHTTNGKAMFGIYKGVKVGVIKTHGRIGTVFPDSNQNSIYRRKKK